MKKVLSEQLEELKLAYENLASATLVLAEKNISNILKTIASSNDIYNLIAEKILGYDFNLDYNSVVSGEISLSDLIASKRTIPFVFCLLNEVDNGKIELVDFIKPVFGKNIDVGYSELTNNLIKEFVKDIEVNLVGEDGSVEDYTDPVASLNELFTEELKNRISYIVKDIVDLLGTKKRVDADIVKDVDVIAFSIDTCLESGQYAGVFGLLAGLKNTIKPLKFLKSERAEIDTLLDTIFAL